MKNLFVLLICFSCLYITHAQSGYLKFDGVDGEATDREHNGWSDLVSFSHSIERASMGATGTTRRRASAKIGDLVCVKELDKSSPKLQEAICTGKVFPKLEVHLTTSATGARRTYYTYELKNVMITSYSISGDSNGPPVEEISANFEEIKVLYSTFDSRGKKKGNVEYSWKVEKGSK